MTGTDVTLVGRTAGPAALSTVQNELDTTVFDTDDATEARLGNCHGIVNVVARGESS